MANDTRLREFQEGLAARLATAREGKSVRARLGFESGGERWLIDLDAAGELLPPPPLAPVPLTRPWFAGIANVRGMLYSVVDFAAFRDLGPTPRGGEARLLLIGARLGINSAILVERALGLKSIDAYTLEAGAAAAPWRGDVWRDAEGERWTRLIPRHLIDDPAFMAVGT